MKTLGKITLITTAIGAVGAIVAPIVIHKLNGKSTTCPLGCLCSIHGNKPSDDEDTEPLHEVEVK